MVLQRNMPVKIWGNAERNCPVNIVFQKKKYKAHANNDGEWSILTDKLEAGGPFIIELADKQNTVQLENVYVGEVWIAGGQSNMEFDLRRSLDGHKNFIKAEARIDNDKVIVTSSKIANPVAVRYKWSNCPDANLYSP
jgi:sialate O-acetylesterase